MRHAHRTPPPNPAAAFAALGLGAVFVGFAWGLIVLATACTSPPPTPEPWRPIDDDETPIDFILNAPTPPRCPNTAGRACI